MNYFINIRDFLPDFLQELSKANVSKKFGDFLLHLIFEDKSNKGNNWGNFLKRASCKPKTDVKPFITIDDLVPYFVEECEQNFLGIDKYFGSYLLHILIRDVNEGLPKPNHITVCKLEHFLRKCAEKLTHKLDATICNIKMSFFFKTCVPLDFESAKGKYELDSTEKLKILSAGILQYPENSNSKQLDEMFDKMLVFIITAYSIGCPTDTELLKQTRQSLHSVLGKGDLQKYVLKKRYHRLEYLQKLSSTVCGIVTFNNYRKNAKDDNIITKLEMAQRNTKKALDEDLKQASECIQKGTRVIQNLLKINVSQQKVEFYCTPAKIHEINKFVILFVTYNRYLERIKVVFGKTEHLIEATQKNFKSVIDKINDILKFRSAIETEIIFPHFIYLSNVWSSLVLHLNILADINRMKSNLDNLLNDNMKNHFHYTVETACRNSSFVIDASFDESKLTNSILNGQFDSLESQTILKNYCGLTMALTGGLLVQAKYVKKLSEKSDINFGFANIDMAHLAQRRFSTFTHTIKNVILSSADMILLFELDDQIIGQDIELLKQTIATKTESATQTESFIHPENQVDAVWNVWDYHRKTIQLANVRTRQTICTQTKVSSGKRNVHNQCQAKSSRFVQ